MTSTNILSVPVQPSPSATRKKGQTDASADQGDFFQLIQNKFQGTDFMGKSDAQTAVGASSSDVMRDAVGASSGVNAAADVSGKKPQADALSVSNTDKPAGIKDGGARVQSKADNADDAELTDEEKAQAMAAIGEFVEEVAEVISEILPVSPEDVASAMDELGLSATDLLDPAGLSELVTTLTGAEDETALLIMDEGKELFDAVGALANELKSETGLDDVTLKSVETGIPVDEFIASEDATDDLELAEPEISQIPAGMENQAKPVTEDDAPLIMTEETVVAGDKADRTAISMTSPKDDEDPMALSEDETVLTAEDAPVRQADTRPQTQDQGSNQDSFAQGRKNSMTGAEIKTDTPVAEGQFNTYVQDEVPQTPVSQVESYTSVNTTDVIEQIVSAARTTITNEVREVSLLLNPQNLGRMIMQVTEREGDISARLVAQNEAVKEALEKQLTILKEQLNAAGIKVTEVEVTVSTHEFEQALEQGNQMQGGSEGGQRGQGSTGEAEAEGGTSSRRSIDLSSEDGLPEDMTEAEALEASMMADAGNSISYSA